ncbi:metallophosphoesterase [Nocardioides sp. KIGAM211]|uniref:Metallophosphoesterase n=1 Tax=Nocardioides luti TaxID=2761101 RepID=A0A7X0RCU1_9ACTN|nr:metallophosphoesterase [Nocardioides luti]
MLSRRSLLRTAGLGAGVLSSGRLGRGERPRPAVGHLLRPRRGAFTFVSTPDFFNGDVADLSVLPTWDGGANSVNSSWETAIDTCLGAVAAHRPDAVFVAGDLVEGHWNIDSDDRRLFGKVSQGSDPVSLAGCRSAITAAGDVYYGYYRRLFADRGLRLYPALGDHEILDDRFAEDVDDRWSPSGHLTEGPHAGEPDNRWHLVPHAKEVWARHFTRTSGGGHRFSNRPRGSAAEDTAYAVDLGPHLTLVTVDVFRHHPGGVEMGLDQVQLAWLRDTVRTAKRAGRVVIVQGHAPLVRPVRTFSTGGLHVSGGEHSALYRALADTGADFYFCGEVHDTTVVAGRGRGPIQISHGSVFRAAFNYLVGQVHADGTTHLDYYEIPMLTASREEGLWASDRRKQQRTEIRYGEPVLAGRLVVKGGRILQRSGKLGVYLPFFDTQQYDGNLATVTYRMPRAPH